VRIQSVRKQTADYSLLILICIVFIIAAFTGLLVFYSVFWNDRSVYSSKDKVINILFIFENGKENSERGVKPLCSYLTLQYPPARRAAVFNVPGDTGRILAKVNRVDRIDMVYEESSPDDFIREIETLFDIDIHYYIIFSLASLSNTVDLLEGIPVIIPNEIEIYDNENSVLFPSGRAVLDGDKAVKYITEQAAGADSLKNRQDRFFLGFLGRLGERNGYLKNARIKRFFPRLMRTNMNNRVIASMLDELAATVMDRMSVLEVEGTYREVSGQKLLIPAYDATLIKDIVVKTFAYLTRESDSGRRVTIEVLNGTNIPGLAARTAGLMRTYGYDVIKVGNAESPDYEATEIIDRIDQSEETNAFAGFVNCKNIKKDIFEAQFDVSTRNYETKADFTLILGRDFNAAFSR